MLPPPALVRAGGPIELDPIVTTPRRRLGDRGEQLARSYLEAKGLVFVEANWQCPAGELDVIMREGEEIVFVEVKLRRGETLGRAEEAVSWSKARKLLRAGEWYIGAHPELNDPIWRIDLLGITLTTSGAVERVSHVENAVTTG
jgi:putative endonuclease